MHVCVYMYVIIQLYVTHKVSLMVYLLAHGFIDKKYQQKTLQLLSVFWLLARNISLALLVIVNRTFQVIIDLSLLVAGSLLHNFRKSIQFTLPDSLRGFIMYSTFFAKNEQRFDSLVCLTKKITDFKPMGLNCQQINYVISKNQINFLGKIYRERFKTKRENITIRFDIFIIVIVPSFSL